MSFRVLQQQQNHRTNLYLLFSTMKQLAKDLNVVAMHCIWRKYRREIKRQSAFTFTSPASLSVNPRQCEQEELHILGQAKQGSADLSTTEQAELMLAQSDSVMDTAEWKADRFSVDPKPLFAAAEPLLPAWHMIGNIEGFGEMAPRDKKHFILEHH